MKTSFLCTFILLCFKICVSAQSTDSKYLPPREHICMDNDWRFAFGHPFDTKKDFNTGTGYFSYFAKAGYADGAAAADFDDRSWRKLDLPHDWAVEVGFSNKASFSHGFKAIGRNFPENSVGWYRKKFRVPNEDYGKRITIAFDGVFRNSIVWVNGHYLGTEESGYNGFEYDITDYLNYGGDNSIAVRADATMEEGWFYEGAGIYRHVWLNKTNPLHVASNGTFVTTALNNNTAKVSARVFVRNDGRRGSTFTIVQKVYDRQGHVLATGETINAALPAYQQGEFMSQMELPHPRLWSVDTPYLHKLVTTVLVNNIPVDQYETRFGIRTIRFDANTGFYLNGKRLEIKGTNNHQEHAGIGTAIPDAIQYFRIARLKEMGSNAYRCSHNPPAPELLDACDSLGMLVIDENRLMGISNYHFDNLRKLIERDRNHPSVISWSIGNEEWGIENSVTGARIATAMQAYAKSLDSTRAITAAFSGGWGQGLSAVMDVIGFNYIAQENPDAQHKKFPAQKGWGTEEGSTFSTRGVYVTNDSLHYKAAYDQKPRPSSYSIEEGWNYYAKRPFLAGMFIWTGFDYRGEPTPYGWPSTGSYFGMLDQCGFLKDDAWYLKAWWGNKPVLHLLPHWNWQGKEGQLMDVWAYSNCNEVELLLNGRSLGKKSMQVNGHLEWKVAYQPGKLEAIGYINGKKALHEAVRTTGAPHAVALTAERPALIADRKDALAITVSMKDSKGMVVPTADNEVVFTISGPGRIIGVGNGNPTSLEPDQYIDRIQVVQIDSLKEKPIENLNNRQEIAVNYNDRTWAPAFAADRNKDFGERVKFIAYRGVFTTNNLSDSTQIKLLFKSIGKSQSVYINGKPVAAHISDTSDRIEFNLDKGLLKRGRNQIAVLSTPLIKAHDWSVVNTDVGLIQIVTPAQAWKRKLFNGLAQVIVQSTNQPGEIIVTAKAKGIKADILKIKVIGPAFKY